MISRSTAESGFKPPVLKSSPRDGDCVAMHEWPILVISSGARDLAFSATCEEKVSRVGLEMTIATQSHVGEERGGGLNWNGLNYLNA
jgi:hypothetical protein